MGEVDLSNEWEQDLTVEAPNQVETPVELVAPESAPPQQIAYESEETTAAAGIPNLDEAMEEVRFYLGQGMTEQAEQVLAKLESVAPGAPELAVLRLGVDSAKQSVPQHELEVSVEEPHAVEVVEEPVAPAQHQQPWPQQRPVLHGMVSEIEESLGNDFLAPSPSEIPAEPAVTEPVAEVASIAGHEFRSGTLDDFVSDLEASLGSDFLPEAPAVSAVEVTHVPVAPEAIHADTPVAPIRMAAAASARSVASTMTPPTMPSAPMSAPGHADFGTHRAAATAPVVPAKIESAPAVDLADMFGELKQELEEGGTSADEDPETHYNLGVAFREMGLLDEAIGEFQKVCQASERGHAFSQLMQAYTWLAQCFLDKGVPEAAVRWYERALKLPNLDAETRTALHYELGSSLENAGNRPAALSNFLEVYGNNIDYRDVAERIKALRT
jgi:TolA-binding protein